MWRVFWIGTLRHKYTLSCDGLCITGAPKLLIWFTGVSRRSLLYPSSSKRRASVLLSSWPHFIEPSRLKDLAKEFRQAFPDPSIPQLPQLFATISGASSTHFYATVVKSNDRIPMFHEVVRWMLQRDLLVILHLRVRIVVPASLKARVRHRREELRENRWHTGVNNAFRRRRHRASTDSGGSEGDFGFFDELPWYTRRDQGSQHNGGGIRKVIEPPILEEGIELDEEIDDEGDEEESEGESAEESAEEAEAASRRDEDEEDEEEDDNETSILADPGRATAVQRRWLQAMSEGKDELVTRRFDQFVYSPLLIWN